MLPNVLRKFVLCVDTFVPAHISLGALLNRCQHPHRPHRRQHPHRLHRRQHHIVLVILVVLIVVMSIIITTMIVVISILS